MDPNLIHAIPDDKIWLLDRQNSFFIPPSLVLYQSIHELKHSFSYILKKNETKATFPDQQRMRMKQYPLEASPIVTMQRFDPTMKKTTHSTLPSHPEKKRTPD